ncbi:MAG: methionine adenosyltransferase domain-containing protein [Candidatus Saccharimonadaceae bacterium]
MSKQPNTTPITTGVYRTAESVSPRHPDKLCDQISDAILDAYLREDPFSRVAVDVAGGHGSIFVVGEVSSKATSVNIPEIVHRIVGPRLDTTPYEVIERVVAQSPEIAQGVDTGGAGDQGIMVGYATSETPEYLPLEYVLARNLNKYLYEIWPFDGKTQVTTLDGGVVAIVTSFQHAKKAELTNRIHKWLEQEPLASVKEGYALHVNPAGDWEIGGFDADSGLTGRKLAVDNYGPRVPLGGGAFSGKDGTKVDRSGAYIARLIAVEYLKKHKAREVFVYLAYAIGYPQPVEATVNIDGVQKQIKGYDLTPEGIIKKLNLRTPSFEQSARYGHF